jgi:hypothetical protein
MKTPKKSTLPELDWALLFCGEAQSSSKQASIVVSRFKLSKGNQDLTKR